MLENDAAILSPVAQALVDVTKTDSSLTESIACFDIPQEIKLTFTGHPKPALLLLLTDMMPGGQHFFQACQKH
jgi:hypothetical protein